MAILLNLVKIWMISVRSWCCLGQGHGVVWVKVVGVIWVKAVGAVWVKSVGV